MTTTLNYAVSDYLVRDHICKKPKRISNFRTSLKHFLRAQGVPEREIKADLEGCLEKFPLACLKDAEAVFVQYLNELVDSGQLSPRSASNLKSDFVVFMKFVFKQDYFRLNVGPWVGKYAPPARSGQTLYGVRRGKGKYPSYNPYSLSLEQWPEQAQQEHASLAQFWTQQEVGNRLTPPVREITMKHYTLNIEYFFGYLINIKNGDLTALGVTLEDLKTPLTSLKITKADLCLSLITEVPLLQHFFEWGINDRWTGTGYPPNSYEWAKRIATTAKKVAQWLNRFADDYDLTEPVQALTRLLKRLRQRMKQNGSKKEEAPPSFQQCAMAIEWLKESCAHVAYSQKGKTSSRYRRTEISIARSWQRYLICALLLYCAMRQRELRELELGRTLFRREDCYWIVLEPADHKNGSKTGQSREYPIPELLTADLDEWFGVWRPKIAAMVAENYPQNEHNPNLVFCCLGSRAQPQVLGQPITSGNLYSLVTYAMYRATSAVLGEAFEIGPHRFRDIAVTHQREHGDPSQREALAEMMGHSLKTADRYYKKLKSQQITQKAKDWWKTYNPHSRPNSENNKGG